nr:MAG TPA: hypothetical protein [Caudoviricetes sp.]
MIEIKKYTIWRMNIFFVSLLWLNRSTRRWGLPDKERPHSDNASPPIYQ